MVNSEYASERTLADLTNIRNHFLALQTLLLAMERSAFEREFGKTSSGEMLRLVIEDPRFAWLRPISRLIVQIDELLEADEPLTRAAARQLVKTSASTLKPRETDFMERHLAALQEPEVIFAHRDTQAAILRAQSNLG